MTFLNDKPSPEVEFAAEIKAAEAELAKSPEPISEPEAEATPTETAPDTAQPDKIAEPIADKPAETQPAKGEEKDKDNKVPLSVLLEERRAKQEMERHYQEMANYVQQMQAWAAQQQGQQQQEEQPIDIAADPIGAMERIKASNERLQQEMMQFRQMQEYQQRDAMIAQTYKSAAQDFVNQAKDFPDAYKYAINSRGRELEALGYHPQAIQQQLIQEEKMLAATALQSNRNPAQVIYEFAKARGYQGPKPVEEPKTAVETIERHAEKAAAATTLSTGGKPPAGDVSDSDGSNLQGAAFDAWFEKKFKPSKSGGLFRA